MGRIRAPRFASERLDQLRHGRDITHLAGEYATRKMRFKVIHVPFTGSAPAITNMMGGNVNSCPMPCPALPRPRACGRPAAAASCRRPLSTVSVSRSCPTCLRRPNRATPTWFGLMAPTGMPTAAIERMNRAMNDALQKPALLEKLRNIDAQPVPIMQRQFAAFVDGKRKLLMPLATWCSCGLRPATLQKHYFDSIAWLQAFVSTSVTAPATEPIRVSQSVIDPFAEITHAPQWILVYPERAAAESPFGTTVAHGLLTLSLLTGGRYHRLFAFPGRKLALNYVFDQVRFTAPEASNWPLSASFRLDQVEALGENQARCHWYVEVPAEDAIRPVLSHVG